MTDADLAKEKSITIEEAMRRSGLIDDHGNEKVQGLDLRGLQDAVAPLRSSPTTRIVPDDSEEAKKDAPKKKFQGSFSSPADEDEEEIRPDDGRPDGFPGDFDAVRFVDFLRTKHAGTRGSILEFMGLYQQAEKVQAWRFKWMLDPDTFSLERLVFGGAVEDTCELLPGVSVRFRAISIGEDLEVQREVAKLLAEKQVFAAMQWEHGGRARVIVRSILKLGKRITPVGKVIRQGGTPTPEDYAANDDMLRTIDPAIWHRLEMAYQEFRMRVEFLANGEALRNS